MTPTKPDTSELDKIFETLTSGLGEEVRKIYTGRKDFKADELLAQAKSAIKNLIAQEANKARLDELSLLLKLTEAVLKENNNEKLFAIRVTKEFDSTIRTRIAQLTEATEVSNVTD